MDFTNWDDNDDFRLGLSSEEDFDLSKELSFEAPMENTALDLTSSGLDVLPQELGEEHIALGIESDPDPELSDFWSKDPSRNAAGVLGHAYDPSAARDAKQRALEAAKEREALSRDVEALVSFVRRKATLGVRGEELESQLRANFGSGVIQASIPTLKNLVAETYLLGNVALDPQVFTSCAALHKSVKNGAARSATVVKSFGKCQSCPKRRKNSCGLFDKPLVKEIPNSRDLFMHYAKMLVSESQVETRDVKTAGTHSDYRLAMAYLLPAVEANRILRASQRSKYEGPIAAAFVSSERREVETTPRDAVLNGMERLMAAGKTIQEIRNASVHNLGKMSFQEAFTTVASRVPAIPISVFGDCQHPALAKISTPILAVGKCTGCVHNRGAECGLNKKALVGSKVSSVTSRNQYQGSLGDSERPQPRQMQDLSRVSAVHASKRLSKIAAEVQSKLESGETLQSVTAQALAALGNQAETREIIRQVLGKASTLPLGVFKACDSPMLKSAEFSFSLLPGKKCAGCVYNEKSRCRLNKRSFAGAALLESASVESSLEDLRFFEATFGDQPDIDASFGEDTEEDPIEVSGLDRFNV